MMVRQGELFGETEEFRECKRRTLQLQAEEFWLMWPPSHRDPHATEVTAAAKVAAHTGSIRLKVYLLVSMKGDTGLTGDEALKILGGKESTVRTRFTELKDLGMITANGDTRANRYGNAEMVWRLA
jgi:hypothetical protein